jgi:hypothetical protein
MRLRLSSCFARHACHIGRLKATFRMKIASFTPHTDVKKSNWTPSGKISQTMRWLPKPSHINAASCLRNPRVNSAMPRCPGCAESQPTGTALAPESVPPTPHGRLRCFPPGLPSRACEPPGTTTPCLGYADSWPSPMAFVPGATPRVLHGRLRWPLAEPPFRASTVPESLAPCPGFSRSWPSPMNSAHGYVPSELHGRLRWPPSELPS